MNTSIPTQQSTIAIQEETARFMSRVYSWMTGGILLSALVAYFIASTPQVANAILGNKPLCIGLMIAQFAAVIALAGFSRRFSASTVKFLYIGYSLLTGVTLSVIFFVYTQQSILNVFAITAFSFGGLSAFGYVTKKDLGPVGAFCVMGLFGMIGYSLLSFFFPSLNGTAAQQFMGFVGIVVFSGLTAYDTQKIKGFYLAGTENSDESTKRAVMGALILYLDFINLFLSILRVMGGNRRK